MNGEPTQERHALLLGASKGIGYALAEMLTRQGLRVTLSGRDAAGLERAVANLRGTHPHAQVLGVQLDLRDFAQVKQVLSTGPRIDHLVLCGASDVAWGPLATLSMDALERALHMKVAGFLNAVQAALPCLSERASITFVGGAAARSAMRGTVGLAAVNGALEAATRTLARELAPRRVNLVSPGLTDTEAYAAMPVEAKAKQFASAAASLPVGRTGLPLDIADAIRLLVNNGFMTGSVVDVDGGAHLG